ncbi:T9SS type A sorting domain-containing protein [Mucilaginibacter auburnensis]|uniref:T9SS type A sorting domain-containing protein n=1 Tax=Mucilaginibacter auburnensis TaxID=1457233 RepID=UPI0012FDC1F5|nr:T9SS type A sorting domain-containing protein [Mucilaginibacter auburnensis]
MLAQSYDQTNTPREYYFNPFTSATPGTPSTYFPGCGSVIPSNATIGMVTSGGISGNTLSSLALNQVGYLQWSFMSNTGAGGISLGNRVWEWEFDYRNVGGTTAPGDATNNITASTSTATDSWRYWLIASSYVSTNNTLGLYVTVSGTSLKLMMKYNAANTAKDNGISIPLPLSTDTYQIRIVKNATGAYYIFVLNKTTNTLSSYTNGGGGYNIGNYDSIDLNTYNYSFLECSTTTANRFQWDNFNFYQQKLEYIPITGADKGITTAIYPGIVDAIPYGVNVNIRGDIFIGRFVCKATGDSQALFESGALWKTTSAVLSTASPASKITDLSVYNNGTSQVNLPSSEKYYSTGNSDGTTTNVINYFLVLKGRNPFYSSFPSSISWSVSSTADDNYAQQYTNSVTPINPTTAGTTAPASPSGNVYDWIGSDASWTTAGTWKKNLNTSTDVPSSNSDIVRIGVVAYTGSNQPNTGGSRTMNKLFFGSYNTPVLTLANNSALTVSNGIEVQTNANATITDGNNGNNNTTITISGGTSSVASGATLTLTNGGTFSNSSAFTSQGTINTTNDFTNTSTGSFTATAGTVRFNRNGDQTITNSNTTKPVVFYNLSLGSTSGNRTKTLSGNQFAVAAGGIITMSGTTTFATSNLLTLNSDVTGTAGVAAIPSGASVTGIVTVQRYFSGGNISKRGWRLLSTPVNNSSSIPVTSSATANFNSLKTNLPITGTGGSANGWDQPTGYTANGATILVYNNAGRGTFTSPTSLATGTVKVGQGFYFYFRGNNSNILGKLIKTGGSFSAPEADVVGLQSGTLNQQNFTYTLQKGGTGFNLVGNPYPSSITIVDSALTGTTGFVYTYTPGGNSVTTNTLPVTIASGQGFFVKANKDVSSIAFSESLKSNGQPLTLLMGAPVKEALAGNIRLQMVQDSSNYDFAQLRFSKDYIENYLDTEDADDLNGSGQNVFFGATTADKYQVAIASQPLNEKKTSVFLSVNSNASGNFTINKLDVSNIPDKYDVWLMDHFKTDSINLRVNSAYNFSVDKTNPLTFGDTRFEVVITLKKLPPYQLASFTGNRSKGQNILHWKTQNEYTYTYFELERSLDNKTFEGVNNSMSTAKGDYGFVDKTASNSLVYYRLKQTDIYGTTYTSIVIIKPEDNKDQVFSLYPNPVSNFLMFDVKEDVKGSISMAIYNSVGLRVLSSLHNSKTGQENLTSLLPGNYTVELIDNTSKKRLASTKFVKL